MDECVLLACKSVTPVVKLSSWFCILSVALQRAEAGHGWNLLSQARLFMRLSFLLFLSFSISPCSGLITFAVGEARWLRQGRVVGGVAATHRDCARNHGFQCCTKSYEESRVDGVALVLFTFFFLSPRERKWQLYDDL